MKFADAEFFRPVNLKVGFDEFHITQKPGNLEQCDRKIDVDVCKVICQLLMGMAGPLGKT